MMVYDEALALNSWLNGVALEIAVLNLSGMIDDYCNSLGDH